MLVELRRAAVGRDCQAVPEGRAGRRQAAMAHLKAGGELGLLADQKMNDGIECRCLGRPR